MTPWEETPAAWESRRAFVHRVLARPRYALDPDDVDDLTGETLVRIFVATRPGPPENPEGFMTTVAHRTAVDWTLRRKRWRTLIRAWDSAAERVADARPAPGETPGDDVLARLRFLALEYFDAHQPACVDVARAYFAEAGWRDVSGELAERPNTLAQRWHRCREQFIAEVRARGAGWLLGRARQEG